jgi:putative ABC transport system substrate-binding protein
MDRRVFIASALRVLAAPLAATAQPAGKVYRIGLLLPAPVTPAGLAPLTKPLGDLGWIEGQNLVIELRYPERGQHERLPDLAAELVRLKVNVIAALGLTAPYATRATSTIPIVLWGASDPVAMGLVPTRACDGVAT